MEESGGALAAITTALDVDPKKTLQYCAYIARRCRDDGPRLTLRTALDEVLDEVIQDESITTLNNRLASCFVAYFELFPGFKAQFTKDFASKDDLMDVLRASCNIPFYFNGNAPCVGVRGGGVIVNYPLFIPLRLILDFGDYVQNYPYVFLRSIEYHVLLMYGTTFMIPCEFPCTYYVYVP